MEKGFIKTSFDLCTGCQMCQIACSYRNAGGYNPRFALLTIRNLKENLYHMPEVCNQCENPYCVNICPVKAITRDTQTGALIVDQDKCVGCGLCSRYCPVGMIFMNTKSGKAFKCDLCGGEPLCTEACPTSAIEWVFISKNEAAND